MNIFTNGKYFQFSISEYLCSYFWTETWKMNEGVFEQISNIPTNVKQSRGIMYNIQLEFIKWQFVKTRNKEKKNPNEQHNAWSRHSSILICLQFKDYIFNLCVRERKKVQCIVLLFNSRIVSGYQLWLHQSRIVRFDMGFYKNDKNIGMKIFLHVIPTIRKIQFWICYVQLEHGEKCSLKIHYQSSANWIFTPTQFTLNDAHFTVFCFFLKEHLS